MTKLLDDAIRKVRELPESEQNEAAEMLLAVASKHNGRPRLDHETRAAVQEGREQATRGEFVSPTDMTTFFKRHGVKPNET
jgi:predicted transcriptional regulator